MQHINDIRAMITAWPFEQRIKLVDMLERDLANELQKLAGDQLTDDLKLVARRFADYDAGTTGAKPWDEAMNNVFGPR